MPVPAGEAVRPTPDRVRETLFNWLGQDLEGASTLELFAGTGVLSLESLSRRAAVAVAVDRSRGVIQALRACAATLGASGLETQVSDAGAWLARESRSFDVIFLDPPFADRPWTWLLTECASRLNEGGSMYAEADHRLSPPDGLVVRRHARAGQVHYHLLMRNAAA